MQTGPRHADHPRPQMTRVAWVDLSGPWAFGYDDADVGLTARWQDRDDVLDRTIEVPFPPESPASGIGDRSPHRVLWYRRTFRRSDVLPGPPQALLLHFGAVDYAARVWVNGRLVAEHEGGSTPFSAEISGDLVPGEEQVVVVRAEDDPHDLGQPRGKQDWEDHAHAIWYDRSSGIWQPVWLEPVPQTRVTSLRWTPDVDASRLRLEVEVARGDARPLRLQVRLEQHGEVLVDDDSALLRDRAAREFLLPAPGMTLGRGTVLWSPDAPNLVEASVRLLDADGGVVDEVAAYAAMRSIAAGDRRILLNGHPYFLRLVLDQGWDPRSHLAAPGPDALREEVELVKSLGFNGVRMHQRLADPRFLSWCDRLGLLVWAEMPAAYEFSTRTTERLVREWLEVLRRDASVPCVVAWVPVNESWGVPGLERSAQQRDLVRTLYTLTKALDPTRLVIGNDGWEQVATDVITVHDYTSHDAVLRRRYGDARALEETLARTQPANRPVLLPGTVWGNEPVVVSEFGGIGHAPDVADSWLGYGSVGSAEDLFERYRSLVDALLDSPALAGFCYTQLTDVLQERNGLLTELRVPKVDPTRLSHVTRRPSAAVPSDEIGSFEYGDYPPTVMDRPGDDVH